MISESISPARPQPVERGITLSLERYWNRLPLAAILLLSAVLNFYGLSRQGYSNAYYAAAIKSMMQSWHNFFFNAFDPGGFVTIDKPPLGFWLQVASAKVFGFNGVSILLPQALAGLLSVALLYYLVSRIFGRAAGLIAALALAVTPISVVTNRNNTIDSTLVLVVLLGAWAVTRAVQTGKLRWLLLCAVFVGLGFNIKMLEAYLVLPAFGLMYLISARIGWGRRVLHLFLAAVVLLVISLSWVTTVDLTPASQRPWVGSTTDNSELSLAIGYNGLQRLTGNSSVGGSSGRPGNAALPSSTSSNAARAGSSSSSSSSSASSGSGSTARSGANGAPGGNAGPGNGGGPGGVGENGPTGPLRLLDTELGSQIGWLLPLAVIGFLVAAWRTRRRLFRAGTEARPLHDKQAALVLWGMWLLTTGAFFSVAGFYHTYYLVMVAPAIAAIAGIGIASLWQMYRQPGSKTWPLLPLSLLAAVAVEVHILADYPSWARWLTPLVVAGCVLAAVTLIAGHFWSRLRLQVVLPFAALGILALMAAPSAWAAYSVSTAQTGGILHAGPTASGTSGGFGGARRGNNGAFRLPASSNHNGSFTPPSGNAGGPPSNAAGGPPGGSGTGSNTPPTGFAPPENGGFPGGPGGGPPGSSGGSGQPGNGGPGGDTQVNSGLVRYLEQHRGSTKYLVATASAQSAESFILATGKPVMALGGFTGSDPILTVSELAKLVKEGTVHYFLLGGMGGPDGGNSAISTWVQEHGTALPASKYSSSSSSAGGFGDGSLYYVRSGK